MLSFISKIYQSIIARDQLVKLFVEHNGIEHRAHPAVFGYDDFENQMGALGDSRSYRKIALKAELKAEGRQLPKQFFFSNYGTRDLVDAPVVQPVQQLNFTALLEVLFETIDRIFSEQPPPLKSSLIPDINLTARLLPAPTLASA